MINRNLKLALGIGFSKRTIQLQFKFACNLACFALVTVVASTNCIAQWELNKNDAAQVEQYLQSIQTDQLLVEHLESAIASDKDPVSRDKLAAKLLNLYATKLMSGDRANRKNFKLPDWRSKTERLLINYPQLGTPTIRMAILQAKYQAGEKAYQAWWADGRPPQKKTELVDQWRELNSQLESLNQLLERQYQDQIAVSQTDQNRDLDSKVSVRMESLLLHSNYLRGWSSFFMGVLVPSEQKQRMEVADAQFRTFLQIEPIKSLNKVPKSWFDFSSQWQTRALVGLAMTQAGLNYPSQADHCFDLIESHATSQQTRDMRHIWELNSRLYLNDYSDALKLAESFDDQSVSDNIQVLYWSTVLDSGFAIRESDTATSQRLTFAGLKGLTQSFQGETINRFAEKHNLQIDQILELQKDNFEKNWIIGFSTFHKAELENQAETFAQAKTKLETALELSDSQSDPIDILKCQFLLARIELQAKNYPTAAKLFLDVSQKFDQHDQELAAESQWLATRALSALVQNDPRNMIDTNREINAIIQRFPGSAYAKRAEFEKLRLILSSLSPDDAIKRLNEIPKSSPNYPVAANEITKRRYQAWLNFHQSKHEKETQALEALLKAEAHCRSLGNISEPILLKQMLLVIDALIRTKPLDPEQIRIRLDETGNFANRFGKRNLLYNEYRYYEFLFANQIGDTKKATENAIWISQNAKGTRFEKSAMIQLTQTSDEKFRLLTNPTGDEVEAISSLFERLVSAIGESDQTLTSSPNARIAFARLSELKLQSGKHEQAATMYDRLNKIFPNNKNYLRNLAVSHTKLKNLEQAIPIWKKLSGGVDPGSELWLESKYNLAKLLFLTDQREQAKSLHTQTKRLCPELPANWQNLFDELSARIESVPADSK